jgi:hypothetical protein
LEEGNPYTEATMNARPIFLATALLLGAGQALLAQGTPPDTTRLQEIRLSGGSVVYGRIVEQGDTIRLLLASGDVLSVPRARVLSSKPARGRIMKGEFWRDDPNRTRLFFGPTARGIRKGEGYFAAYELIMPFLGIAVTDDLVLAGGTPLFGGMDERPYWLAPKLRIASSGKTDVAVGALVFAVEDESAGVLYGVATHGSADASVSLGIGYGFADGELADHPALMGGFDVRMSKGTKLISENYLFPGGTGLVSFGPRFFGEKLSADLGIGIAFANGESTSFPIVNFVWAW